MFLCNKTIMYLEEVNTSSEVATSILVKSEQVEYDKVRSKFTTVVFPEPTENSSSSPWGPS